MLSNTCKYAVRAATYLAAKVDEKSKIGLKQISEELDIPAPFLGKILQILAKNKLLDSAKGPNGGFSLAKAPALVSVYDIIEIIDGTDVFTNCLLGFNVCQYNDDKKSLCPVYPKVGPVLKQLKTLYKEETLEKLVTDFKKMDNSLRF